MYGGFALLDHSLLLEQNSEMNDFCLKQEGMGLKALAANLYPDFPCVPPDNFQLHVLELVHFVF